MLLPITNDVLDIAWRIKDIEPSYYIMYDTDIKKFLLFSKNGLELKLPYNQLDERSIRYARDTRIDNLDILIKEIDKFNDNLESEKTKEMHNTAEEMFDEAVRKL